MNDFIIITQIKQKPQIKNPIANYQHPRLGKKGALVTLYKFVSLLSFEKEPKKKCHSTFGMVVTWRTPHVCNQSFTFHTQKTKQNKKND